MIVNSLREYPLSQLITSPQIILKMFTYLLTLTIISITTTATQPSIKVELEVPSSFAFITVTHTRGNDYKIIQDHIQRYAAMDCPIATELNIVWNNQITPEKAPITLNKDTWKRNVYFYKTPNNSMDWRYKIPSQSKAKVFFIIDDDVVIDCVELQRGFKVWQENAVGNVGPIVTYAVRFFQYTQKGGFSYGRTKEELMYSLGLVGISFMSRHFMELYYSPLEILEEMREIVRNKNNCDDIGLNWLIQYFYPELETVYVKAVKGNLLAGSPAIAQSTSPTHYPYRSQCIMAFTNLFGVNALRYKPINDNGKKDIRIKPLREATVLAKQKYFESIIKGQPPTKPLNLPEVAPNTNQLLNTITDLELKLADAKELATNFQDETRRALDELKECQNTPKIASNSGQLSSQETEIIVWGIPLTEILGAAIVLMVLAISSLVFCVLRLSNENKMLQLRSNQINAVDSHSSQENE